MYRVIGRFDTNDYEAKFSAKDILSDALDLELASIFLLGCCKVAKKNNLPAILFIQSSAKEISITNAKIIRAVVHETRVIDVLG